MKSNLFNIKIPDNFAVVVDRFTHVRFANKTEQYDIQNPFFYLYLCPIKDIETQKGNTFLEQYIKWSEGFKTEVLSAKETSYNGYKAFEVCNKTDTVFQGETFKIEYINVIMLLDETWCLNFQFVYEIKDKAIYQSIAQETLLSITINGNASYWKEAYLKDIKATQETALAVEENIEKKQPNYKINPFVIPKDGKDVFKINNKTFEIDEDASIVEISNGSLYVNINAEAEENTKFEDFNWYFFAKHIYVNKGETVTRVFNNEEKEEFTIWKTGFKSGNFLGEFTVHSNWIAFNGIIKKSYSDSYAKVEIYKQFSYETLNWSNYQFTLEEAIKAPSEAITNLFISDFSGAHFPQAIFQFKNLKDLTILGRYDHFNPDSVRSPLLEIPLQIDSLSNLEKLSIANTSIESLPETIGNLKQLTQLGLSNNKLEALPISLFQLPKLKFFWVNNNSLTRLPSEIELPTLESFNISGNQLDTLPLSLAKQAKLKKLNLAGNRLTHLPDEFNTISDIELASEDKRRLLNFDYQGADGKGISNWNDDLFFARNNVELIKPVDAIIDAAGLSKYKTDLRNLIKRTVAFSHTQKEDYKTIGNTRFGGMPDLPPSIDYPRFGDNWREDKKDYSYEFLAQINCTEIAHLQEYLPRTGMLYVFLETYHNVYDDHASPIKIIYYNGSEPLISGTQFKLTEDDYFEMGWVAENDFQCTCYQGFKVQAELINSAPSFYAINQNKYLLAKTEIMDSDEGSLNEDLKDRLADDFEQPINNLNSSDYEMNGYGFTQHESPEHQASLKLKGNPEDWINLLTIKSCGDMQWGDSGDLFIVIHKSDLAKQDFSNVFCTIESS